MEKPWEELSPDEKREAKFQSWLSPKDPQGNDVKFQSPEAEKGYKERTNRIKDAILMKKLPDRVPVLALPSYYPMYYAGLTPHDGMYDYEKCTMAYKKFVLDFEPDGHLGAAVPGPGKFFDILDYKLYAYAGHGVSPEHPHQCVEGEYMMANEYDALIQDPTRFFSNVYLPRVYKALEPFNMLPTLPAIVEMYGVAGNFVPFGLPPVQGALKALMEAGTEALKWAMAMGASDGEMISLGYPSLVGGFAKAPFDVIGDTLRGTKGIMTDIYRQPEKLLEALDALTPIWINYAVGMTQMTGNPIVVMPLHKGADGFLSDEQFKRFYWPSFRNVLMGLIDQGCVPFPFVEGGFNTRLKVIRDVPKGKIAWLFDLTDMARAKDIVGNTSCICGNMPSSLLGLGTAQEVRDYAKKLLAEAAKGGGFIMSNGAFFDHAKPENIRAMIEYAKEHGVYK